MVIFQVRGAKAPGRILECCSPLAEANGNINPWESDPKDPGRIKLVSSGYRQLQLTVKGILTTASGDFSPLWVQGG